VVEHHTVQDVHCNYYLFIGYIAGDQQQCSHALLFRISGQLQSNNAALDRDL
jgi:hypothetical protein